MPLKILPLTDKKKWQECIERLTRDKRDLHYLPEYSEIYQRTYGLEPFCAYFELSGEYLIQVFVKKPINNLSFLKPGELARDYYDLANPYGYGGPVFSTHKTEDKKALLSKYRQAFSAYCQQEGIVTEFTSLHPLFQKPQIFAEIPSLGLQTTKKIVYINLLQSEASLKQAMSRGVKSNLNKAIRLGVTVEQAPATTATIDQFKKIYYETMRRKGASQRWIFPEDYFTNCLSLLGEDRVSFFFAQVGSNLASAYLLIHAYDTCYYHFGGSDPNFTQYRASNLLMLKTILFAKEKGYKYYHLGGGVTNDPQDKLFLYKKGFSPDVVSLHSYKVIHNLEIYNKLCKLANTPAKSSGYFPAYRQKEN